LIHLEHEAAVGQN